VKDGVVTFYTLPREKAFSPSSSTGHALLDGLVRFASPQVTALFPPYGFP